MKRVLSLVLALSLCTALPACSSGSGGSSGDIVSGSAPLAFTSSSSSESLPQPESPPAVESGTNAAPEDAAVAVPDEIRSVWVSYLELSTLLTNQSEAQYRQNIAAVMADCADFGLNTVILQVRPFGDAIYPSQYFPQSYLFDGTEGAVGAAPFDALAIAVEEAHRCGLRLEAWINPYRVRAKADKPLHATNPANAMLQTGAAVRMGETITYNPANAKEAQALIVNGVTEIVQNYEVDGIHFDDYFYPTTDPAFDARDYAAYRDFDGPLELAAWRRSNVTKLIRQVHSTIAKHGGGRVTFGISPQGNNKNNLDAQYVDVAEIVQNNLVDYICPQMYFGYQNSGCPYQSTIEMFDKMTEGTDVDVYVGLASYKFNKTDTWAGNGKSEWIDTTDLLKRQVESARKLSGYGGFVLYRYDSSFAPERFYQGDATAQAQAKTELANLKQLF